MAGVRNTYHRDLYGFPIYNGAILMARTGVALVALDHAVHPVDLLGRRRLGRGSGVRKKKTPTLYEISIYNRAGYNTPGQRWPIRGARADERHGKGSPRFGKGSARFAASVPGGGGTQGGAMRQSARHVARQTAQPMSE